jgi:hypothetical protein
VATAHLHDIRSSGITIVPDVLTEHEALRAREALLGAAAQSERRGLPTFMPVLDPNDANVRAFNLLDMNSSFHDLIMHPLALALARGLR